MNKRRLERVAVMILSIAMLLSSTGILSSLAANVGESDSAQTSAVSETGSTTVNQETTTEAQVSDENGNGTVENPYKISNADEFLNIQKTANLASSSNKNFVLTADIDLSGVTEETFRKNGGSLVAVDGSANSFFNLDGNRHKIKGLNVKADSSDKISIFGVVNAKSSIKNLVIEEPKISSKSENLVSVAVVASENKGTISNVKVMYPVITVAKCTYASLVVAVNNGTVSNVTVQGTQTSASASTADSHTIAANGIVGAVAAVNNGNISAVSAINIGMFIPEAKGSDTVYGGIAGYCEGTVSDSVSTGNVCGGKSTDIAGGIAGKAVKTPKLTNNYTLVSLSKSVQGAAVIGSAGKAEMIKDCFWSATVSKKSVPVTDFGSNENNVITNTFKVVSVGKTAGVSASDVSKMSWGKALFSLDGKFTSKDSNIKANSDSTAMTINGEKADSISKITYVANITLPATVGAGTGSVTVKQYMNIYVLTVPENVKGNGTEGSPLEISNSAEFSFLKYAVNINCKLTKDIVTDLSADYFCGTLDGNGHTVSTDGTLFNAVCGTVKNLSVVVTENISRGVFANVYGAKMSNVNVELKDGVKFTAEKSNTGIFANRIGDAGVLDDCRVKGEISVSAEKLTNIGGFAGLVSGKDVAITNSGACVDISGKKAEAANFVGSVSAENATIENCYAAGANTSGEYMFISAINAKAVTIKNIYIDYSDVKSAASKAVDFETYKALVNENQFTEWAFNDGVAGFFTGNGGKFTAEIPAIKSMQNSSAADYKLSFDSSKITASVAVDGGKLTLNVNRVNGVVTVKAVPVTVTNEKTGLSAKLYVSNGLEKDASGNWIISNGFDLAYVSENIAELADDSFVVNSDIDMTAIKGFAPIGSTAVAFSGKFDGNGHTISNLTINGTAKTALFGVLSDAEVKNIKISNANINSESGYAAVLAGQATGKTVISNIKVNNSKVAVNGNYAAVIVASVDNASGVKISDITVDNSAIKSSAGYVGAVAGHITENTAISDVNIYKFKASGSNYVSGIAGLAQSESATTISDVKVVSSDISGVSEISGIASGIGNGFTIKDSAVVSSKIATLNGTSAFTAGGVAAVYGSVIDNVSVEKTEIKAGIAGGAVAKTAENSKLDINKVTISGCKISADEENTVAAGLLGVHNTAGTASIKNSTVSTDTVISGAAVTAGVVGDCFGADSVLSVENVKTFATVEGSTTATAVSAAGVLGRIGSSAINGVQIKNTVVGGTVSGEGVLGGIIGLVKNGESYNGKAPVVSATTAYPQIKTSKAQSGMIIGGLESKKVLSSDDLDSAVVDVIISTYFGDVSAYSAESKLEGGKYFDMDKPDGKAITASVEKLTSAEETEIKINNLPKLNGFSFDTKSGWISESDERIQVISCTENTAVLKAQHMADISIIGYYVLDSDSDVKIPVHFRMISDIRTPLKGSGTKENPYLVSCAYDLETVAQYDSENAYFALTNDITFVPADFEFGGAFYNVGNGVVTIGDVTNAFKGTFTGLYNGKVHSITGLAVAGNAFGGLFGATDGAVISDIIINNAKISGLNYAGVVAGSAKNTTIKNIVINSADVETTELGGYVGAIVGNAENTIVSDIQVNGAEIKTSCQANGVSVEAVGGVAGVFSGSIENVKAENVKINSTSVAGGAVGIAKDSASVKSVDINAEIKAQLVGGIAGRVDNPLKFTVSECNIGGVLEGAEITAGVIGKVMSDSSAHNVSKAETPMVSDTLVTAKIAKSDICGVVVGEASAKVFTETENKNTDVFKNVYYSSYQNNIGAFGVEEINAYQNSEYLITDLSDVRFTDGMAERAYIPLGTEPMKLNADSIKLNGADGSYKLFSVNEKVFKLQTIKAENSDIIVYDAAASTIRLDSAITADEKAVFVYNDGLELAIPVAQDSVLAGLGTEQNPYVIDTADDFAAMLQNASAEDVYYKLGADINLKGIGSAELFAGVLDGNGHVLYDYTGASLFGRVTGEIRNIGFVGFDVTDNKSVAVGAVAGVLDGGKIADCFVIANVSANAGKQDAGVLAGRAINGAQISGVLTSGKVVAEKAIAVGGVVGLVSDSELTNVTSTAYVKGGSSVGGLVGEMLRSTLGNAVFGNMVEAVSDCGNAVGSKDKASTISSVYVDSSVTRTDKAVGSGEKTDAKAMTTAQLKAAKINGFSTVNGYPVPAKLTEFDGAKFAAGVGFASMTINYLAGLSAGTVYNYTDITADTSVNGNDVALVKGNGLTLTLVPNADYSDAENAIMRYTNPLTTTAVDVNCSFVDATSGKLGSGLVGVLLKSKAGEDSSAFDFFMKANADEKDIGSVVVIDGKLYVNAELPAGVKFSVTAVDENGKPLSISDAKNEGMLIATGNAKSVSLVITAENDSEEIWGLRSLSSVIGK